MKLAIWFTWQQPAHRWQWNLNSASHDNSPPLCPAVQVGQHKALRWEPVWPLRPFAGLFLSLKSHQVSLQQSYLILMTLTSTDQCMQHSLQRSSRSAWRWHASRECWWVRLALSLRRRYSIQSKIICITYINDSTSACNNHIGQEYLGRRMQLIRNHMQG